MILSGLVSKASIGFFTAVAVVMLCFLGCPALVLFVVIDASFDGELGSGPGCGTDKSGYAEGQVVLVSGSCVAFTHFIWTPSQSLRHVDVIRLCGPPGAFGVRRG
jgi:hypothetical protein